MIARICLWPRILSGRCIAMTLLVAALVLAEMEHGGMHGGGHGTQAETDGGTSPNVMEPGTHDRSSHDSSDLELSHAHDESTTLHVLGGSLPGLLYENLMFAYETSRTGVVFDYQEVGSEKAKCRVMSYEQKCEKDDTSFPHEIDFAASDSLLSEGDYEHYPDLQMLPAVAGAVAPIVSIPELAQQGLDLVLSPGTLGEIFVGNITTWNDARILTDQIEEEVAHVLMGLNVTINVVVRAEKSGATMLFKQSLAAFVPLLKDDLGVSSESAWSTRIQYKYRKGNKAMATAVLAKEYSIGYVALNKALNLELQMVGLRLSRTSHKHAVFPSATSVGFAVAERGLDFGNTGEPVHRLTAHIFGASGSLAWPITGYTYFVLRMNTLHPNSNCMHRKHMSEFFNWFYTDPLAVNLAKEHGFAPLTESARSVVLSILNDNFKCKGQRVFDPPEIPHVRSVGGSLFENMLEMYSSSYKLTKPRVNVSFSHSWHNMGSPLTDKMVSYTSRTALKRFEGMPSGFVVVRGGHQTFPFWNTHHHAQESETNFIPIPFAAVAYSVVYNFCEYDGSSTHGQNHTCQYNMIMKNSSHRLVLSPSTIADIFDGTITSWDDDRLHSQSSAHLKMQRPANQTIIVLCIKEGEEEREIGAEILREYKADFNWRGCHYNLSQSTLYSILHETPMVMAFVPNSFQFMSNIQTANISLGDGTVVAPTLKNVLACTTKETYDHDAGTFDLRKQKTSQAHSECYPLTESINFLTRMSYTGDEDCGANGNGIATTRFLSWMLHADHHMSHGGSDMSAPIRELGLAPLTLGNNEDVNELIKNALFQVTCDGASILNPEENLLLLYIPAVSIGFIIISIVVMLFRGGSSLSQAMAIIFSDEVSMIADVALGVGDILAFTISTLWTVYPYHDLRFVAPLCTLFICLGWIVTVYGVYSSVRTYRDLQVQRQSRFQNVFFKKHAKIAAMEYCADHRKSANGRHGLNNDGEVVKPSLARWINGPERSSTETALQEQLEADFLNKSEIRMEVLNSIEDLSRLANRKKDDFLTVICEALPVSTIQLYLILKEGSYSDLIGILSLTLSGVVLGAKIRGIHGYSEVHKQLKEKKSVLKSIAQASLVIRSKSNAQQVESNLLRVEPVE